MFPGWWMPLYGRVRPHLTTCLIWPQHCFSMKPTLCLPITRRWCLPSSLMNARHVKRYRHDRSRCTVILCRTYILCLIYILSYLLCTEMNTHSDIKSQKCFVPALADSEKHTYFPIMLGKEISTFQTGLFLMVADNSGMKL